MGYENMAKKDKAQEKAKDNGEEQEKKAKRKITEATPEVLAKILEHKFKKGYLKMVLGKQTGVVALIYKESFNPKTHTGWIRNEKGKKVRKLTPKEFIKIAHSQGFSLACDGVYIRLWSSRYFKNKTGEKTAAVDHERKAMTFEEMKEAASKMELKNYTKKGSKASLAASLRRALKKKAKKKFKKHREEAPEEIKASKKHEEEVPVEKKPSKKDKEEAPVEKKHSEEPKGEAPAEESSKKVHKRHLEAEEPSKDHKKHHLKEKSPEERFAKLKKANQEATEDIVE